MNASKPSASKPVHLAYARGSTTPPPNPDPSGADSYIQLEILGWAKGDSNPHELALTDT